MATPKLPTPADPLASFANILKTAGGTTTTTSPGDTAALQSVLAQLQGQDPQAQLQAIFAQAGGQIPGLQAALANAIGARRGGNSAVQAALSKLTQQTALAGQQQIAQQQAQNLQTQAQAAAAIAQATKGTTQRKGTDMEEAGKNLVILQLLSKTGLLEQLGLGTQNAEVPGTDLSSATANLTLGGSGGGGLELPQLGSNLNFTPEINFEVPDRAPVVETTPTDTPETIEEKLPRLNEPYYPEYADGGIIRVVGGRRSTSPRIATSAPTTTAVTNTARAPAAPVAPVSTGTVPALLQAMSSYNSPGEGSFVPGGSTGSGAAPSGPADPSTTKALSMAANINALSGLTGGSYVKDAGLLGLAANLSRTKTRDQALRMFGTYAGNKVAPGLGSAVGFAYNPTVKSGVNMVASLNPLTAAANIVAGLTGLPSAGELASRGVQNYKLGTEVAPNENIFSQYATGHAINNAADPLGALIQSLGLVPTATSESSMSGDPAPGFGDRGPGGSSGDPEAAAAGANAAGPGGHANGGPISGPGTGTSDSILARLSDGEYVISADTVNALGEEFFDALQAAFHTPVATSR